MRKVTGVEYTLIDDAGVHVKFENGITQVFPDWVPLQTPEPSAVPAAPATPSVTAAPDPAAIARDRAGFTIAAGLIAVVVVLFGGRTLLARRSDRNDPDRP